MMKFTFFPLFTGLFISFMFEKGQAEKFPARLDYRLWNDIEVVSPVQDQGQVGSCWTFSTTGSVEAQMAMAGQGVVRLSQQQLVDCVVPSKKPGEEVFGFSPYIALQYLRVKGSVPAFLYPYISNVTMVVGKCAYKKEDVVQLVDGVCRQKTPITEDTLKEVLFRNGPQVVSVNTKRWTESATKVLSCPPNSDASDHAVLLTGYDKINGEDVWIFKNSWGNYWGNNGFGHLTRSSGKDCGILVNSILSPIVPDSPLKNLMCQTPPPRYGGSCWNYDQNSLPHESDSTPREIGRETC